MQIAEDSVHDPYVTDISHEGHVVVGSYGEDAAARWTDGVLELLPPPEIVSPYWSPANTVYYTNLQGVSADGLVAIGYAWVESVRPIRWDADGGVDLMASDVWPGFQGFFSHGKAYGLSPDGSVIVGCAQAPPPPAFNNRPYQPVRWDDLDVSFLEAGTATGGCAYDVSADGTRVVGGTYTTSWAADSRAVLWDADGSLGFLEDALLARGVDLSGWTLKGAAAISDDGVVVAGNGLLDGVEQGFVASLGPTAGIDIRPGSPLNQVSLRPGARVAVVLYGTQDVDAAAIDLADLAFGPAGAPVLAALAPGDVNADGRLDRLLLFDSLTSGIAPDDAQACLVSEGDVPFRVCSHVAVVPRACGLGFEVALLLPLVTHLRRRRARR
jgi:hypothetical protein